MNPKAKTSHPTYSSAALSDTGKQRKGNEDRFVHEPERGFFAVIDGVGGYAGGDVAAEVAREALLLRLGHRTGSPEVRLREAISLANNRIYKQSRAEARLAEMACVLTAVVLEDGRLYAGHVGDTRLYKLHNGAIDKLTCDHSVVGVREDAGDLTEAEAMRHPRRNEILRDVGSARHNANDAHFIETLEAAFEPDAALLLCSDGLTDLVPANVLLRTVHEHRGNPEAAVQHLVDLANDAGGTDNITVLLIEGEAFAGAPLPLKDAPGSNSDADADSEQHGAGTRGTDDKGRSNALPFLAGMVTMAVLALCAWLLAGTPFAVSTDDTDAAPEPLLSLLQNRLFNQPAAAPSAMLDASTPIEVTTGAMPWQDSLVLSFSGDTLHFAPAAYTAGTTPADSLGSVLYGYYLGPGPGAADSAYSLGILLHPQNAQSPRLRLLILAEPADSLAADSLR